MATAYRSYRNYGCRLTDDLLYRGYRCLLLENDKLQIMLLTDKGGEPARWLHKPTDTDFIWHTRMGLLPRHPEFADYQMSYMGGWQEMLPEVSHTHEYRGAVVHRGESAITPWHWELLRDDEDEVSVRLTNRIRSLPLVVEKAMTLRRGEAKVRMEETVRNEAPVPMEFNWGHHLAYGSPFLDRDSIVEFPAGSTVWSPAAGERRNWPHAPSPGGSASETDLSAMAPPGTPRELMAVRPPEGVYRLRSPRRSAGLEVRWNRDVWPYVWYWQNFAADVNAPFFGCEYNIGLEPFNVPPKWTLAEAAARGAAIRLEPFGSVDSWLEIAAIEEGTPRETK